MPPSRAEQPVVRAAFIAERYAVYDEFAAGGMATVHLARLNGAHGFRRTVAVKRLLPHLLRNRDFAMMLIDEARLAARVRHPNVVTTLDVVQTTSELLLVMDYIHGDCLAKLSRWSKTGIPCAVAAAIMADALHGLHAAHEAKDPQGAPLNLVHRDVSPHNVLVGLDGITRIADFGIAKAAGRIHTTDEGIVKGKLAYMAPEQLGRGEVSRLADVFAASVVLWELLTGARLFAGSNQAETVFKLMSQPIALPSTHQPSLPAALEQVVMRGLEREPSRRFSSAREMALALESAAPSVRPSEVAAWVEQAVGERLSGRAMLLEAIERAEASDTEAQTRRRDVVPEEPLGELLPAPKRPSDLSAGALRSDGTSAESGSSSRDELTPMPARLATSTKVILLAVALSGLVAAAWASRSDGAPRKEKHASAQAEPRWSEPVRTQQGALAAAVVTPVEVRVTSIADASVREEADGSAAKEAGQRPSAASPAKAGAIGRRRPTRAVRPACDPPYTLDSEGRVLFKVECVK